MEAENYLLMGGKKEREKAPGKEKEVSNGERERQGKRESDGAIEREGQKSPADEKVSAGHK